MNKKNVVFLVESPSKIKIFNSCLPELFGKKFIVLSTFGHIRELDTKKISNKSNLGFESLHWKNLMSANKILKSLQNLNADDLTLFIATDPDREGEAIAWHIQEVIKAKFTNITYQRIYCHELNQAYITNAINKVLEKPQGIYMPLVNAYMSRVIIDISIGFKGSPLLWAKLYGCKSMGRVQTVSLLKLFEQEKNIRNFEKKTRFKIECSFTSEEIKYLANDVYVNNVPSIYYATIDEAKNIKKEITAATFTLENVKASKVSDSDILPLDLVTLMLTANRKYHMSPSEVAIICQKLYEGVKMYDSGVEGLITYSRTDSKYICDSFALKIQNKLLSLVDKKTHIADKRIAIKKGANAQEAHEAIRLTNLDYSIEDYRKCLGIKEYKIMQLIYIHTMCHFIKPTLYERTLYTYTSSCNKFKLTFTHYAILERGYRAILDQFDDYPSKIKNMKITSSLCKFDAAVKESITLAPFRYSESKLIDSLRNDGIGRPSTYTYIINLIKNRNYAALQDKHLYLSSIGHILVIFVQLYLSTFINYKFTSEMECTLDKIANKLECGSENTEGEAMAHQTVANIDSQFTQLVNSVADSKDEVLKNIEKYIKENYSNVCDFCSQDTIYLKFFSSGPFICCECKKYQPLNKFGYKEQDLVDNMPARYMAPIRRIVRKVASKNKKPTKS